MTKHNILESRLHWMSSLPPSTGSIVILSSEAATSGATMATAPSSPCLVRVPSLGLPWVSPSVLLWLILSILYLWPPALVELLSFLGSCDTVFSWVPSSGFYQILLPPPLLFLVLRDRTGNSVIGPFLFIGPTLSFPLLCFKLWPFQRHQLWIHTCLWSIYPWMVPWISSVVSEGEITSYPIPTLPVFSINILFMFSHLLGQRTGSNHLQVLLSHSLRSITQSLNNIHS